MKVQRVSKVFDQLIDQQLERRRRKIETPRFVLQRVIDGLQSFCEHLRNEPNQRYNKQLFLYMFKYKLF